MKESAERIIEELITAYVDEDIEIAEDKAAELASFDNEAVLLLVPYLEEEYYRVRKGAVLGLGYIGSPEAVDLLLRQFDREEQVVRDREISYLERSKSDSVMEELILALQRVGTPAAVERLVRYIAEYEPSPDNPWENLVVNLEALMDLRVLEAVPTLYECLRRLPVDSLPARHVQRAINRLENAALNPGV
jgi:HEAT repeat protein